MGVPEWTAVFSPTPDHGFEECDHGVFATIFENTQAPWHHFSGTIADNVNVRCPVKVWSNVYPEIAHHRLRSYLYSTWSIVGEIC